MQVLKTKFGKTYFARNILLGVCLTGSCFAVIFAQPLSDGGWPINMLLSLLLAGCMLSAILSRALFYVMVIPTTMPGAFFWKNKGFEQHARDIGLAAMPQVGVAPGGH